MCYIRLWSKRDEIGSLQDYRYLRSRSVTFQSILALFHCIHFFLVGGTLRWKAPELLEGASTLTQATDVYAFAILCIEVLGMGQVPWCLDDDESVRHFVLSKILLS